MRDLGQGATTKEKPDGRRRPPGASREFFSRVLDNMPAALLVVGVDGQVLYGNRSLVELTGHPLDRVESNVLDFIHPDDHDWVAASFVGVTQSIADGTAANGLPRPALESTLVTATPWASIRFRMITADGDTLPVEVTGMSGLHDPQVGGIVYDVRAASGQQLMREVLTGLAERAPIERLLGKILEMISIRPLDLDAVILQPTSSGTFRPIVATADDVRRALDTYSAAVPWNAPSATPRRTQIADLPNDLRDAISNAGYVDLWHIAVESSMTVNSYRILVFSREQQIPDTGVLFRIQQAAELARVVLFRAQADELLHHAATHDSLTGLANRAGFYDDLLHSAPNAAIGVLYLDIDGLKPVNDAHGHHAGDIVLQRTADRIRSITRLGDHAARLGGDEFAVVIAAAPDSEEGSREFVEAMAQRLLEAIAKPIDVGGVQVSISASVGIAFTAEPTEVDKLLSTADAAMYEAKRAGGNQRRVSAA